MTFPHGGASIIWRDGEGPHRPTKTEIRSYFTSYERKEIRRFDTFDLLSSNLSMAYVAAKGKYVVSVGAMVTAAGFQYKIADEMAVDAHLTTAGGIKLYVQPGPDGRLAVNAFGTDNVAWQKAVTVGGPLRFMPGDYAISASLVVTEDIDLDLTGARFTAEGAGSDVDFFTLNDLSKSIKSRGGEFREARWAFRLHKVNNVDIEMGVFRDLAVGVAVISAPEEGFTPVGKFSVQNCDFDDMEVGAWVQSGQFEIVNFNKNKIRNLGEKPVVSRIYPLNIKIIAGFWYQSLIGSTVAHVEGNLVDGIVGFAVPPFEPEVHGLAVSLHDGSETDVLMHGNTVKNVYGGTSIEGTEGIMGRGKRVIISTNTLCNAGAREGMIYAKGSRYHEIVDNIIEATAGHPDLANVRGIISTGSDCSIRGNKFVGMPRAIYTRAVEGSFTDNEFIGVTTACVTLALELGTAHIKTVLANNKANKDCGSFLEDVTATSIPRGDVIIENNQLYNGGPSVSLKGAETVLFKGNLVNRMIPTGARDALVFTHPVAVLRIIDNEFVKFDDNGGTGRVLTGNTANTPRVFVRGNYFGTGYYAFWMRDQTYDDYIFRDNDFFSSNAINGAIGGNVTVTGIASQVDNVGLDIV